MFAIITFLLSVGVAVCSALFLFKASQIRAQNRLKWTYSQEYTLYLKRTAILLGIGFGLFLFLLIQTIKQHHAKKENQIEIPR